MCNQNQTEVCRIFVPQISAKTLKKTYSFPARLVSTSADATNRKEFYLVGRKDQPSV
jgi:hypothetical protein